MNSTLEAARKIDERPFGDGNRFSVLQRSGAVVRCWSQDDAETVMIAGVSGATVRYGDNYVAAVADGDIVAIAWPQS